MKAVLMDRYGKTEMYIDVPDDTEAVLVRGTVYVSVRLVRRSGVTRTEFRRVITHAL